MFKMFKSCQKSAFINKAKYTNTSTYEAGQREDFRLQKFSYKILLLCFLVKLSKKVQLFHRTIKRMLFQADVPSSSNHSENLKLWPWDEDLPPAFDTSDGGFLSFVPPPPRPWFLEDVAPDGVTTCDLCSWAMQDGQAISFEGRGEQFTVFFNFLNSISNIKTSFISLT